MWSSVGSVGTVDLADTSKINFSGSVAQLGRSIGVVEPAPVATAALAGGVTRPKITATIRYGVTAFGLDGFALGDFNLRLRYRDGDGQVVATFIEEPIPVGPTDPGTVVENSLIRFDSTSASFGGPSNVFRTHDAKAATGQFKHLISFTGNVYYVDLVMTAPAIQLGQAPAVSAIEIFLGS